MSSSSASAASSRAILLATVTVFAMAVPGAALAQPVEYAEPAGDMPSEDFGNANEIVVTATKREQTLQDVPVAVTVATAARIERAQIRDLKDLGALVPSLRIGERQSSAITNFFIRGFGNGANNVGIEPSVGVFIDGVYRSRTAAQISDLPDLDRIEVLRGPQSTLFGKNASAGIVSIVTQKPQFDFGGNVEASYGNYDALVLKGVVTGPVAETVAASLSAGYNRRDGYVENLGTGNRMNDRDRWFVRGQMLFQPDSQLSVRLIGDYGKIDEVCCSVVNVQQSAATAAIRAVGGNVNEPGDRFNDVAYTNFDPRNRIENWGFSGQVDYALGPLTLTSITAYRRTNSFNDYDADFTSADLLQRNEADARIKTFTQEFRATASVLDKVTALVGAFYFNEKIDQAGPIEFGTAFRPYADLLIRGRSGGALNVDMLESTFGTLEGAPDRYLGQFFGQGQGLNESYRLKNEAISIFAQVDLEIAPRLMLTGGVNYTHDRKNFSVDIDSTDVFSGLNLNDPRYAPFRNTLLFQGGVAQQVGTALGLGRSATSAEVQAFAGANGAAFGQIAAGAQAFADANQNNPLANPLGALRAFQFLPPFLDLPNAVESGRTRDNNVSWTARLSYDATDTINIYAGVATGFKASSINLSRDSRPFASDRAALESAGLLTGLPGIEFRTRYATPETATVYEAGLKANWGLATANVAVFQQNIKGFQSNIFTGTGFVLTNAGKQSVFGIEFEGTVRPVRGLTLGMAVTYLDPKYDDFQNSAFGDATGVTPADIPPISATFNLQYDHRLANEDRLILYTDFHYESDVQTVEGLPAFIVRDPATNAPVNFQPGFAAAQPFRREVNELNASITYAMRNGLELTVWGRNLLDYRNINVVFDSVAQAGSVSAYTNQPRTYGAAARFRW
jgi:iron complex outermembrane recepter protein